VTFLQRLSGTAALTVLAFAAAPGGAQANPVGPTTTFYFSGDCDDCAGTLTAGNIYHATGDGLYQHVTGTLVLSNFTPGVAMTTANFVSFSYDGSSVLQPFTVTAPSTFSATLNADGTPAGAGFFMLWDTPSVQFAVSPFATFCNSREQCEMVIQPSGVWHIAYRPLDFGINGTFAVPEPLSIALFGSGLVGLAAALRRRRDDAEAAGHPLGQRG